MRDDKVLLDVHQVVVHGRPNLPELGRQLDLHGLHKLADAVALPNLDLPPVARAVPVAVRDL
jgi:hypothetical protein